MALSIDEIKMLIKESIPDAEIDIKDLVFVNIQLCFIERTRSKQRIF